MSVWLSVCTKWDNIKILGCPTLIKKRVASSRIHCHSTPAPPEVVIKSPSPPSFVYIPLSNARSFILRSPTLPHSPLPMLTLGTTLAFLELATEEAALPDGLSAFSPASALMRSAIWRHSAQSIVHTAFFGLQPTRGRGRSVALGSSRITLCVLLQYLLRTQKFAHRGHPTITFAKFLGFLISSHLVNESPLL